MRKRGIGALVLGGTSAVAILVGWLNRESIVRSYVEEALQQANVAASYDVAYIGVREQRLSNVRIGDPNRPDLTARTVTLRLNIGWAGPEIAAVEADGLRLRGQLRDGKLSFGAIDRLLPESDGSAPDLPAIHVGLRDSAVGIATPWGAVGVGANGSGMLNNGFVGRVAVNAPKVEAANCAIEGVSGVTRLEIRNKVPEVKGPIGISSVACSDANARLQDVRLGLTAAVPLTLQQIKAQMGISTGAAQSGDVRLNRIIGDATADIASLDDIKAVWSIAGRDGSSHWGSARETTVAGAARYTAGDGLLVDGGVRMADARISQQMLAQTQGLAQATAGTPVAPLAAQLSRAIAVAGRGASASAQFSLVKPADGLLMMQAGHVVVDTGSGANIALERADAIRWTENEDPRFALDGRFGGGGLPQGSMHLSGQGDRWNGTVSVAPYVVDDASLALAPLQFRTDARGTRFATAMEMSGPMGDGRVERLAMPVEGYLSAGGTVTMAPGCRPISWSSLHMSGTRLDATQVPLCIDAADPLRFGGGGVRGTVRTAAMELGGTIGQSPFHVALANSTINAGSRQFLINGLATRLGSVDAPTRITAANLTGNYADGGFDGEFTNLGGQIAAVPLILSEGQGRWRYADSALTMNAGLTISDSQSVPRFTPVKSPDAELTFVDGAIRVTGGLIEPRYQTRVADAVITHNLSNTAGEAVLSVPNLNFTSQGLQPAHLTNLALGVVADVNGSVQGQGRFVWNANGVTSTGQFTTSAMNLAAAFGPVQGISGTIHFSDLIALATPTGQEARVASINPGVEVTNGILRYQLLPNQRIKIESGYWPFAGGELRLRPTMLDFGTDTDRHLTFDVDGADAALFLQRYEFDNITATGVFDGTLPTRFNAEGGMLENGVLRSRAGGSLAYVGELSNRDLGMMANLAFGALKSLKYNALELQMNGKIDGEMLTRVSFSGLAQGEGADSNIFTRALRNIPIKFDININAPFRQLLTSARGLYDPTLLIEQNLPTLLQEQEAAEARARAATQAQTQAGAQAGEAVQPPVSQQRR